MKRTGIKGIQKTIIFILVLALMLPLCPAGFGAPLHQVHAETSATRYFYNQLNEKEKPFYDAMEEMLTQGIFKTGTQDYELTGKKLSQEDVQRYAGGFPDLLNNMGAARDAFYFDHPDVFYVDFSALSLRVTTDSSGSYHVYLGTGRRDNYFTQGFTSETQVEAAIKEYDKKVNEIVEEAKNQQLASGMDRLREQVTFVHNKIIKMTSYKLENQCKPANIGFVRTSYGALVKGEGVCEAYSRAVKSVLDRLGIPCVLVQGVYRHTEENLEPHMWNYVQLDGKWYGVDATMDDPVGDGLENSELLLVGGDIMDVRHVPSAVVSAANRAFTYPALAQSGLSFYEIQNTNGLVVEYKSGAEEGIDTGTFRVSYRGMGYQEAAKKGKYILARFYQYLPNTGEYVYNDWAYADPTPYDLPQDPHALIFPVPHIMYAEFAVTDIAPAGELYKDGKLDPDYYYYKGDPLLFEAVTDKIYNPNGTYVAPPYPKAYSPSTMGRVFTDRTYDINITYDDKLIKTGSEEVSCKLTSTGNTGVQYSQIKNFEWDGESTFTFQFTPSQMFADESVLYTFQFTGLVGEKSGKAPIPLKYISSAPTYGCIYWKQGYDWKIFGQPSLLAADDLSMAGWKTKDGAEVSDLLKNQLALVVTSPSKAQTDTMNDLIDSANPDSTVMTTETYNITLTLCKSQIIETGQSVHISVGFPAGYGPDDEGVTFKAYHFKKNDAGEVIDIEEIDCVVTRLGLILTCKSFSPFAIAVLEGDDADQASRRNAVLTASYGGKITSKEGSIVALQENDTVNVTVTPDAGYLIESVYVGENKLEDIGENTSKSASFELSYDDLASSSTIVSAQFIAQSVYKRDAENGESAISLAPDAIVVPEADHSQRVIWPPRRTNSAPQTPSNSSSSTAQTPAGSSPSATQAPAGSSGSSSSAAASSQSQGSQPTSASANTAAPTDSATTAITPAPSAASTPVSVAATDNKPKTDLSKGSAETQNSTVETETTADSQTVGADNGDDIILAALPGVPQADEDEGKFYWLILPILALAAALGAGLYYFTRGKHSTDDWL